jgi:hypothetical protein
MYTHGYDNHRQRGRTYCKYHCHDERFLLRRNEWIGDRHSQRRLRRIYL